MTDGPTETADGEWLRGWLAGPQMTRWDILPPQVGDPAPDLELETADGSMIELSSLWANGPALLMFWRHYGCSCGMDRAARLRDEYAVYVAAGASVGVIGMGEPALASAYAQRQALPCRVLCDPDRRAYRAYGLLEGDTPHILFDAPDAFLRREPEAGRELQESRRGTERALVDDPWQLPGEFVVDGAGVLHLTYRYQYCEDYPDPRVLVAAIRIASGELTRRP
ncbi:MAG: peroxiredoxin-like family protein [Actinomycetota bacterium]